jgi:hypothetical protein
MMLTQAQLREVLYYDPETGFFTRLVRGGRCPVGDVAGYVRPDGYRIIRVKGRNYRASRLAWLYMTGEWPAAYVDHINCVRYDNRWINLRPADATQNMGNARKAADNTSGYKGVCWVAYRRKWKAQIGRNGESRHLGYFDCPAAAHAAYVAAAEKRFGEFARAA